MPPSGRPPIYSTRSSASHAMRCAWRLSSFGRCPPPAGRPPSPCSPTLPRRVRGSPPHTMLSRPQQLANPLLTAPHASHASVHRAPAPPSTLPPPLAHQRCAWCMHASRSDGHGVQLRFGVLPRNACAATVRERRMHARARMVRRHRGTEGGIRCAPHVAPAPAAPPLSSCQCSPPSHPRPSYAAHATFPDAWLHCPRHFV